MGTISKDLPLLELILRKYEKPYDASERDIVRKLCLSLGILQPGDSRDVIVDVLLVLLKARSEERELTSEDIRGKVIEHRKDKNLRMNGIAPSNIRRQIKRLREIFLVEKTINKYRITEFEKLDRIYEEKIEKYLLPSIQARIKSYLSMVDERF